MFKFLTVLALGGLSATVAQAAPKTTTTHKINIAPVRNYFEKNLLDKGSATKKIWAAPARWESRSTRKPPHSPTRKTVTRSSCVSRNFLPRSFLFSR